MSVVNLQQVKADLKITDDNSDAQLQILLDAALAEAAAFCNTLELPSSGDVQAAVFLLVRSKYDLEDGREIERYRNCAEVLLQPHRVTMGV